MSLPSRLRANLSFVDLASGQRAVACGDELLHVFPQSYARSIDDLKSVISFDRPFEEAMTALEFQRANQLHELYAFLHQEGVLVPRPQNESPIGEDASFYETLLGAPLFGASKPTVQIFGESKTCEVLHSLLIESGLHVVGEDREAAPSCKVVDCNSIGVSGALDVNRSSVETGVPVLYSHRPSMLETTVGPFVVPGVTPCFSCFYDRWTANSNHLAAMSLDRRLRPYRLSTPAALASAAASALALEVLKHFSRFALPSTWSGVLLQDHRTGSVERHHVLRIPTCPACAKLRHRSSL